MAGTTDVDTISAFQLELPYELGRYLLDAEIGRGGMGIVYHADDTMLERPVAVKVLLPQLAADAQFVQRFKREAQMAARLEHPNIVTVHDVGQVEGLVYFVMRLIMGRPLDLLIEEGISWARAENIAVQVADAMAYAHGNGVIHRDIKPENVIIGKDGAVTITDFGLARPQAQAGGPTQAGVILGTPGYMAPEQALGGEVDHRADIYAFGVMLFELATGQLPFDGPNAFTIINQHISAPPPKLTDIKAGTPSWLVELVGRLMEKEPDKRPQSMAEVSAMLQSQQGSAIETPVKVDPVAGKIDAQTLVAQVRGGNVSLTDAISKHPEFTETLQEVFRREMTAVCFDLAGSTALKQSGGGTIAIGPLFSAYRQLVDQMLADNHCVDSVWAGDGTVAMFNTPSEAVTAAQAIVRGLTKINERFKDTPDLGVRVGIHTGQILRDPNQSLGQVTSTTLDITGHLQKDARVGLVEVSQTTLDKLKNQEGWLRIRTAREGNLAVFAWHPEGPEHIPQSWIQRMRFGRGEAEGTAAGGEHPAKEKAASRTTGGSAAKRTTGRTTTTDKVKKDAPAKPEEVKYTCPYCEGEVTVLDQKCPHCSRLNRHYDPAIAEKGQRKKATLLPSAARRTGTQLRSGARTTMAERAQDPRRTSGVLQPGTPQRTATAAKGKAAQSSFTSEVLTEILIGLAIGTILVVGVAWVMVTRMQGLWWVQRGGATAVTSPLGLVMPAAVDLVLAFALRAGQPAASWGTIMGLPVGYTILRMQQWWV